MLESREQNGDKCWWGVYDLCGANYFVGLFHLKIGDTLPAFVCYTFLHWKWVNKPWPECFVISSYLIVKLWLCFFELHGFLSFWGNVCISGNEWLPSYKISIHNQLVFCSYFDQYYTKTRIASIFKQGGFYHYFVVENSSTCACVPPLYTSHFVRKM